MRKLVKIETCLICGGDDLIINVRGLDQGYYSSGRLTVGKDRNPHAMLFKGMKKTSLSAAVCADCGYVYFFADNPKRLKFKVGAKASFTS